MAIVAADGATSRRILRSRGRPETGIDRYLATPPAGPGVLVERDRTRSVVRTRQRRGRLQMRIVEHDGPSRQTLITGDGRVRPFRFRPTGGDRLPGQRVVVAAPDGWYVDLRSRHGTALIVRVSGDGTVRRLMLGAAPLTLGALHGALGLPADDAPASSPASDLRAVGYEAASDSAIVAYEDAAFRPIVARIPIAGGPPALVHRGEPDDNVQLSSW